MNHVDRTVLVTMIDVRRKTDRILCCLLDNEDILDMRILVANSQCQSLMANSWQVIRDLRRAAGVKICGNYELRRRYTKSAVFQRSSGLLMSMSQALLSMRY
jgi:hypothetical protein